MDLLTHADAATAPVHLVAHYLRSHGLRVIDGIWPGDEIPAHCIECEGLRFLIVPVEADWSRVEAVNLGRSEVWAGCFGAVAVEMASGALRVLSRARKGWRQVRSYNAHGMPYITIAAPAEAWHPISTMVKYLHERKTKDKG